MLRLPFMPQAFFSVLNPGKRVFFWRSEPQKKELSVSLKQEIIGLTLYSCGLGILLGTPLSWGVWTIFRYTLADTPEMILLFDIRAYLIPIIFTSFILIALLWILSGYMKRTDILSIIHQSHRAEALHPTPRWFGPVSVLLFLAGIILGYFTPTFCVRVLHWYAPKFLTGLFYLPAFAGLYMMLLHTVVNGWRRGKTVILT